MEFELEFFGVLVRGDDDVYKPSEDSLLLLDWIISYSNPSLDIDLDIGAGSGLIGIGNAKFFNRYTLLVDISYKSLQYCWRNAGLNEVDPYIDTILYGDGVDFLREGLEPYVMCNPPYLPVYGEVSWWSGGTTGLDLIIRLLDELVGRNRFKLLFVYSSYTDLVKLRELVDYSEGLWFDWIDYIEFGMERIYLGFVCKG